MHSSYKFEGVVIIQHCQIFKTNGFGSPWMLIQNIENQNTGDVGFLSRLFLPRLLFDLFLFLSFPLFFWPSLQAYYS
jgi:hypothetical protein